MGEKSIMATMEECKGCGDELRLGGRKWFHNYDHLRAYDISSCEIFFTIWRLFSKRDSMKNEKIREVVKDFEFF